MVNSFSLTQTPRIVFGSGTFLQLPDLIESEARNALILTGKASFIQSSHWERLQEELSSRHIDWFHYPIDREPSPAMIDDCVAKHQQAGVQIVVAIGGGSVLDAGKAVSAMLTCIHPVRHYLEGVGDLQPPGDKLFYIAVPTTAGTGSEATKNAVLSEVGITGFKKSLRHENYVPDIALIDPLLSLDCPPALTAASGMDAFTQLLESYVSTHANPMTDALAEDGLKNIQAGLLPAFQNGHNRTAREHMAYAALLSGITLANAGLGLVHGFASSVGARIDVPHGALCGSLMGAVNRVTLQQLLSSEGYRSALEKYGRAGRIFADVQGKSDSYYAAFLVELIDQWVDELGLPRLAPFGLTRELIPDIAAATSLKYHPVPLGIAELEAILMERL